MRIFRTLFVLFAALSPSLAAEYFVYIGTYTGARTQSKGIYVYRFDSSSGKLDDGTLAAEVASPSYVALHPNRKYLYAVSEMGTGALKGGAVSAFSIDPATGKLTLLNQVSSRGGGPCYVTVDRTGKNVLIANYNTGSVAAMPIKPDGSLAEASAFIQHTGTGADPRRQRGPHAHSINMSLDNRFAIAADLGLDKLFVYRFDPAKGTLAPNDPPYAEIKPASGPRHFDWHPSGKFGYVICEMGMIVTALSYNAKQGSFQQIQTISTLPEGATGKNFSTAHVQVHPSGKFLYGSNRGHDSIETFAIDQKKGTLTAIENVSTQGKTPRNFGIDPSGSYLFAANQDSSNITVFRIDQKTGRLTPTGQSLKVGGPVCVKFLPIQKR